MVKKRYLDKYGSGAHNRSSERFERGILIFHEKLSIRGGLLRERIIWKLFPTIQYPNGG